MRVRARRRKRGEQPKKASKHLTAFSEASGSSNKHIVAANKATRPADDAAAPPIPLATDPPTNPLPFNRIMTETPQMTPPPTSLLERMLHWVKNNKTFSTLIFLGICITSVGTVFESLTHIRTFLDHKPTARADTIEGDAPPTQSKKSPTNLSHAEPPVAESNPSNEQDKSNSAKVPQGSPDHLEISQIEPPSRKGNSEEPPTGEALRLTALRTRESLIDIVIRNTSTITSVIHSVELITRRSMPIRSRSSYRALPSTFQYHFLISPWSESEILQITQEIPPGKADRFQIIVRLGRTEFPLDREGPWGYSLIFPPKFPGTDESVESADMTMALKLHYDEGDTLLSPDFTFRVNSITYGYKAKEVAGLSMQNKILTLDSNDVNVVQSVASILAHSSDSRALEALRALRNRDHTYLAEHYQTRILGSVEDPSRFLLPPTDRRMEVFRRELDEAIGELEENISESGN